MTNREIYDLYNELNKNTVVVKKDTQDQYVGYHYLFGIYDVMYADMGGDEYDELYIYKNKDNPQEMSAMQVRRKYEPEYSRTYTIYQDVKKKSEGKPYKNPNKEIDTNVTNKTTAFEQFALLNIDRFSPKEMSVPESIEMIKQMKSVFESLMRDFYTKEKS